MKLELLKGEGVFFDKDGMLKNKAALWEEFDLNQKLLES